MNRYPGTSVATLATTCLLCLLVVGCASSPISDLYEFYPVDSEDERKLFGYRFVVDPAQRQTATSKRKVPLQFAVSFENMREELNKYMGVFHYCLEGYFVYDESFDGQRYILHGECKESK